MTISNEDAAAEAKEHIASATDALHNASTHEISDGTHPISQMADHASVELDVAKAHAVSAIDTLLQSTLTALKNVRSAYQRNPRMTLTVTGGIVVGLFALVTLLRRL